MTLTLRIENFDSLPDGGPLSVTTNGQPLQIGRSASMDWTLPDPQRHISGHHFDVSFSNGQYYLTDVSTNGVFLEGQRHRIEGAHVMKPGERFQVGHYFIIASFGDQPAQDTPAPSMQTPAPLPPAADSDPWAVGGSPAAPIDPNPPLGPAAFEDFASDFISTRGAPAPAAAPIPAAPQPAPAAPAAMGSSSPFDAPSPPAMAPPTAAPAAATPPAQAAPQSVDVLRAFCDGAGLQLPPGTTADPEAFAFELGRTLRGTASAAMSLLNDRDTAKKFIKTADRTMLSANPLKRLTDVNQALEVMFIQPKEGFTSGGDALIEALGDVHSHQRAIFAAIQPALIKLMASLAPEDIEEAVEGGILSGGKRKAWDEFVRRWDGMTTEHENGMLDVFLAHFAESYGKANGGLGH